MLIVPNEVELLDFFECDPIDQMPEEGFYCYQVSDKKTGLSLILSFSGVEGSVQVRLTAYGEEIALFSQEGAKQLMIRNDNSGKYLSCEFDSEMAKTTTEIRVLPKISVKWNTLLH